MRERFAGWITVALAMPLVCVLGAQELSACALDRVEGPARCSRISVPEDDGGAPGGRRIELNMVMLPATATPSSDTTDPNLDRRRDTLPLALPRLRGPVAIDGRIDDAWRDIEPLQMTSFEPVAGRPPSESTRIRVAFDDAFLYIAAELGDSSRGGPTLNSFTRDRWANDDLLEIVLDTYNDNENAVIFGVNPAGTRFDSQVRNDGEFTFGFPVDYSWNAFWDAATRRTPDGWTAEMRIPFSSLRFQPRDGRATMGMIVSRFIARKNETVTFPSIDPRWNFGFNKPSQGRDISLEGVAASRPVYLAPYVLGGGQITSRPDSLGAPQRNAESVLEIGGDVRFALTDNMSVDLTINTDFAQVEADEQQVNLTRFSLFFPEKRQFFQERSGIFEFRTGGNNRLFHSRRIGIADDGLARIIGGGRLVGRVGGWDLGALDLHTAATAGTAAENFFVARARRRVINDFSQIGGMLTSRTGAEADNVAYGVDGTVRVGGSQYVTASWAQSFTDGTGSARTGTGLLMLEDRDRRGLGYRVVASRAGAGFDPRVGFVQRRDYRDISVDGTWGLFASDSSIVRRWGPRLEASYLVRDSDGAFETGQWSTGWQTEFKNGTQVNGSIVLTRERLDNPFRISDVVSVPAGAHNFTWGRLFANTSGARTLSGSVFAQVGQFYDGRIIQVSFSPRWRFPPYLEIAPEVERTRVRFSQRAESFDADVARLRLSLSLNTALSADALVQYASEGRQVLGNGRLRYQFAEGRNFWVVVNDSRGARVLRRNFLSSAPRDRTIVVKYVQTFRAF